MGGQHLEEGGGRLQGAGQARVHGGLHAPRLLGQLPPHRLQHVPEVGVQVRHQAPLARRLCGTKQHVTQGAEAKATCAAGALQLARVSCTHANLGLEQSVEWASIACGCGQGRARRGRGAAGGPRRRHLQPSQQHAIADSRYAVPRHDHNQCRHDVATCGKP